MTPFLLWTLVVLLLLAGLAGTVLPMLPGTALIFAAVLLGAWIDDFARIGTSTLIVEGVLMLLAVLLDYVAGLLGARSAGASPQALIGASLGTVAGLFMGLVGVLFMPFVGAVAGELIARRNDREPGPQSIRIGVSTWLGIMAGMLGKVVIALAMIGLFVVALWH